MQCENHEAFVDIALGYGWEMFEYGIDTSCEVGGDAPHKAIIWLKPCAWDPFQMIPVGCLCCTNLDEELLNWNGELFDVMESRRIAKGQAIALSDEYPLPETPPGVLSGPPSFLRPYRAR